MTILAEVVGGFISFTASAPVREVFFFAFLDLLKLSVQCPDLF